MENVVFILIFLNFSNIVFFQTGVQTVLYSKKTMHIFQKKCFLKLLQRTFAKKQPFYMHKKARIYTYKFRKIKVKTTESQHFSMLKSLDGQASYLTKTLSNSMTFQKVITDFRIIKIRFLQISSSKSYDGCSTIQPAF